MSIAARDGLSEEFSLTLIRAEIQRLSIVVADMNRQHTSFTAALSQLADRVKANEQKLDRILTVLGNIQALLQAKL
jgi:hypothetical protein